MNPSPRDTPSHRRAAIYREAARLVETKERAFTCCAILQAVHGHGWPDVFIYTDEDVVAYARLMSFNGADNIGGSQFYYAGDEGYSVQDVRILALCFAAAITERP